MVSKVCLGLALLALVDAISLPHSPHPNNGDLTPTAVDAVEEVEEAPLPYHTIPLEHEWKRRPDKARAFLADLHYHQQHVRDGSLLETAAYTPNAHGYKNMPMLNHLTFYTGNVTVGSLKPDLKPEESKPQRFKVIFDTGSMFLMVPSIYCQGFSCADQGFDPALSSSYRSMTPKKDKEQGKFKSVEISYASGSVLGVIGKDTIEFGGVTIKNVEFGQIVRADLGGLDDFEGVLGLGPPGAAEVATRLSQAQGKAPPAEKKQGTKADPHGGLRTMLGDVTSLISTQNVLSGLSGNLYSFYLSNMPEHDGALMFGGWDPTLADGPLYNLPLLPPKGNLPRLYWEVELHAVKIGGKPMGLCGNGRCTAVVDTGTSLIVGDNRVMGGILNSIDVSADCKNLHDQPDITFTFVDEDGTPRDLTLAPIDYTYLNPEETKPAERIKIGPFEMDIPGDEELRLACAVGIASNAALDEMNKKDKKAMKDAPSRIVLGGTFLRKFLTVFDYDNSRVRIGVAKHRENDHRVDPQWHYKELETKFEHEVAKEDAANKKAQQELEDELRKAMKEQEQQEKEKAKHPNKAPEPPPTEEPEVDTADIPLLYKPPHKAKTVHQMGATEAHKDKATAKTQPQPHVGQGPNVMIDVDSGDSDDSAVSEDSDSSGDSSEEGEEGEEDRQVGVWTTEPLHIAEGLHSVPYIKSTPI